MEIIVKIIIFLNYTWKENLQNYQVSFFCKNVIEINFANYFSIKKYSKEKKRLQGIWRKVGVNENSLIMM